jgi:hypothetical protein
MISGDNALASSAHTKHVAAHVRHGKLRLDLAKIDVA